MATAAEDDWYLAHCDGGSRGNPGPSGYGAVIEDAQGRVVARLSDYLGQQTNNYAEYQGLLAVLGWALEHGIKRLRVVSDSELMVNQMKGRYKVASPVLRPLWEEAKRRTSRLVGFELRHTLRGGNREADKLANAAMDKGMSKGPGERLTPQASQPARAPEKRVSQTPAGSPGPRVLEGYVEGGVVRFIGGKLPEGTFVTVYVK